MNYPIDATIAGVAFAVKVGNGRWVYEKNLGKGGRTTPPRPCWWSMQLTMGHDA